MQLQGRENKEKLENMASFKGENRFYAVGPGGGNGIIF